MRQMSEGNSFKPLGVLRALLQGQEVILNDSKFKLVDNKLSCGIYYSEMSLTAFIQRCNELSDDEYAIICMDIALNSKRKIGENR